MKKRWNGTLWQTKTYRMDVWHELYQGSLISTCAVFLMCSWFILPWLLRPLSLKLNINLSLSTPCCHVQLHRNNFKMKWVAFEFQWWGQIPRGSLAWVDYSQKATCALQQMEIALLWDNNAFSLSSIPPWPYVTHHSSWCLFPRGQMHGVSLR